MPGLSEQSRAHDPIKPQLRAVCLRSERETDLLLTTTHRMCDGMSVFLIVRELLRSLHDREELIPYDPITVQDIIGDYRHAQPWKRKLAARVLNGLLRLVPSSRRKPENHEHSLEWTAGRALSNALKRRCKAEGVTLHALLVAALEQALYAVFGKKAPKTIVNPIDLRRGRFAALKSDMVFFGGGNFKVRRISEEMRAADFWARVRRINEEMRTAVEEEIRDIPGRFDFLERLRPLSSGQIQWMVRLSDALPSSASWNGFGFSNLGNVSVVDSDSPFRLKDLHLYVHSFGVRLLGLIPYTVNGEMRFYWVIDEKMMSRAHVERLNQEFTSLLQSQTLLEDDGIGDASLKSGALAE